MRTPTGITAAATVNRDDDNNDDTNDADDHKGDEHVMATPTSPLP